MLKRRDFITQMAGYGAAMGLGSKMNPDTRPNLEREKNSLGIPIMISTWEHGMDANKVGWDILRNGGRALDAVERGVRVVESDPSGASVGIGGTPDRDGHVTLDACIMDENGDAGAVCFVKDYLHPISIARKVMEETPHVMLAGKGAELFAESQGFEKTNLLTSRAEAAWQTWMKKKDYHPIINRENHDTISSLAIDQNGNISGACTTSGLGYKMHGRVGDSPIIGAGLYVDNEVGACAATGLGELVMKTLGSFLVVELMRQGRSPAEACKEAIMRIVAKNKDILEDVQVCYIAVSKDGQVGSYSIHEGFDYALSTGDKNELIKSEYFVKP